MTIRPPVPDDVPDFHRIVAAHGVPAAWRWPDGKHGLVVDDGRVVAFCVLSETIWGLVIDELWEEQTRDGFRALSLLSRYIETVAQRLANERGAPLACGGIVHLDRATHIAALRKRGYGDEAVVLAKTFTPQV